MKNKYLVSFCCIALLTVYTLGIIGFDIHTCSSTKETFSVSILSGTECSDIHPEHAHQCITCHCCAEHNANKTSCELNDKECCSDTFQALNLTGEKYNRLVVKAFFTNLIVLENPYCRLEQFSAFAKHINNFLEFLSIHRTIDCLSFIQIFRI